MIPQKSGMVIIGAVILMVVLAAGCLGSTVQKPMVPCSATLVPGQLPRCPLLYQQPLHRQGAIPSVDSLSF